MTVDEMVSLLGGTPTGMMGRTAPGDEPGESHRLSDTKEGVRWSPPSSCTDVHYTVLHTVTV